MTFRRRSTDGPSTGTGHLRGARAALEHGLPTSWGIPFHRSDAQLAAEKVSGEEARKAITFQLEERHAAEDRLRELTDEFPALKSCARKLTACGHSPTDILADTEFARLAQRARVLKASRQ